MPQPLQLQGKGSWYAMNKQQGEFHSQERHFREQNIKELNYDSSLDQTTA